MSDLNKVMLIGRVVAQPELKQLNNGGQVANIRVVTNRVGTKDGEKQEYPTYHTVVAFDKLAENAAKYLDKGRQVYVEGELQTRTWEKDGEKRYMTEILARRIDFLGSKPAQDGGQQPTQAKHTTRNEPQSRGSNDGWGDGGDGDIAF